VAEEKGKIALVIKAGRSLKRLGRPRSGSRDVSAFRDV